MIFQKYFKKKKEQQNFLESNEINLDENKTQIEIEEDGFEIIKRKKKERNRRKF